MTINIFNVTKYTLTYAVTRVYACVQKHTSTRIRAHIWTNVCIRTRRVRIWNSVYLLSNTTTIHELLWSQGDASQTNRVVDNTSMYSLIYYTRRRTQCNVVITGGHGNSLVTISTWYHTYVIHVHVWNHDIRKNKTIGRQRFATAVQGPHISYILPLRISLINSRKRRGVIENRTECRARSRIFNLQLYVM